MPRHQRLAEPIVRPLRDLFLRRFVSPDDDPWEPVNAGLQRFLFGDDVPEPFRTLPDGVSSVPIGSIDEICAWLQGCEYVSDQEQFGQLDFWQHPVDFERRRKGDCEDHALWAWRKMVTLGHPAQFFLGRWQGNEEQRPSFHAWVVFEWGGRPHLMETVLKRTPKMVYERASVKKSYTPHFSFEADFSVRMYTGFLQHLREKRLRTPPGAPEAVAPAPPRTAPEPSAKPDPAPPTDAEPR